MGHLETARSPCATGERFPTSAEAPDASSLSPTLGNVSLEEPRTQTRVGATAIARASRLRGEGIRRAEMSITLRRLGAPVAGSRLAKRNRWEGDPTIASRNILKGGPFAADPGSRVSSCATVSVQRSPKFNRRLGSRAGTSMYRAFPRRHEAPCPVAPLQDTGIRGSVATEAAVRGGPQVGGKRRPQPE